jgi:hypothetical protein
MWKRLRRPKLWILIAITGLLVWLSFRTLLGLITSPETIDWRAGDELRVIVPDRTQWSGTVQTSARIVASDVAGSATPILYAQLDIQFAGNPGPAPAGKNIYLVASGAARSWTTDCITPEFEFKPGGGYTTYTPTPLKSQTEPPAEIASVYNNHVQPDEQFYTIPGGVLSCAVSEQQAWVARDATYAFTPPPTSILALDPNAKDNVAVSIGDEQGGSTGLYCSRSDLSYGAGVSIDDAYPLNGTIAAEPPNGVITRERYYNNPGTISASAQTIDWPDCITPKHPGPRALSASQLPVRIQLKDIGETARLARSTFWAGVLAAILGALILEIINAFFERDETSGEHEERPKEELVGTERDLTDVDATESVVAPDLVGDNVEDSEPPDQPRRVVRFNQR